MLTPDALTTLRARFPAIARGDLVFFDNPGGTQVPQSVIDAVADYYRTRCANTGGAFATSRRTDETIAGARQAMADLLGTADPETIIFGPSMTALAFHLARSIARTIRPGDEVIVTDLDHDANITPWTDLEAAGAVVRAVPVRIDDGTLDTDALYAALRPAKTRLIAVGAASNALGTITDLVPIIDAAHAAGALVFVDAVQAVPHLPTDVEALGCDFLACSAYKFFGPHVGVLYGKREHLERLTPHKVRPASDAIPYRWEQGTLNHEGLAGVAAAADYLAGLTADGSTRRERLTFAMTGIRDYERTLSSYLLNGLSRIPGVRLYGIADPSRTAERVPTIALTKGREHPRAVCERLATASICAWNGNYYALRVMERLGLEGHGGAVRIGLCHYNTPAEIDHLLNVLAGG
jgi:cysteine desulfurase family protein (TIGR01976 family)